MGMPVAVRKKFERAALDPSSMFLRNASSGARNCATRMNNYTSLSNGTDEAGRFVTVHYAARNLINPVIEYGNSYVSTDKDTPNTNDIVVRASIEYPVDSGRIFPAINPLTGRRALVINPGGIGQICAWGVSIPKGAQFGVRTYVTVNTGWTFPLGMTTAGTTLTEKGEKGAAATYTDHTLTLSASGGVANGLVTCYSPLAIQNGIEDSAISLYILGDSIPFGTGEVTTATTLSNGVKVVNYSNAGWVFRSIMGGDLEEDIVPFMSHAKASARADLVRAGLMQRLHVAQFATHAIIALGINDLINSRSPANTWADLLEIGYMLKRLGLIVHICNLTPYTSSTDGYRTIANQSTQAIEANRLELNALIEAAAESDPFSGLIDVAGAVTDAATGKWKAPTTIYADCNASAATATTATFDNITFTASAGIFGTGLVGWWALPDGAPNSSARQIVSNTSTQITLASSWASTPSTNDNIHIYDSPVTVTDGLHPSPIGHDLMGARAALSSRFG